MTSMMARQCGTSAAISYGIPDSDGCRGIEHGVSRGRADLVESPAMRFPAPALARALNPKAFLGLYCCGMTHGTTAPLARTVALAGQAQASDT